MSQRFAEYVAALSAGLTLMLSVPGHADDVRAHAITGPLWTDGKGAAAPTAPLSTATIARLARSLGPAVVNVTTWTVLPDEDASSTRRARGQGTGFVIHRSGLIVTNNHVVENAEQIKVVLADETELTAHLVGRDDRTDLALLTVDADHPLPVAPLGDSDRVEIGEWVVAIGNPFGLDHTVTAGIVSGKGRRDVRPGGLTNGFYDFLQTDASINTGNSGGPLIDMRGRVIGINTAINAHGQGIAFAIPINMAKTIVRQLYASGRAPRSWMGVVAQPLTSTLRRAFKLPGMEGALVSDVVARSPAAGAGLAAGDVILEMDGHAIRRADDLAWLEATTGAGKRVSLGVVRDGERRTVTLTLAPAPEERAATAATPALHPHQTPFGMTVAEITVGIARELGEPALRGLVVMSVEAESPAADAGVEQRDVLMRVGEMNVKNIDEYSSAVHLVARGDMIRLLVRRYPDPGHNHTTEAARNLWLAFPKR